MRKSYLLFALANFVKSEEIDGIPKSENYTEMVCTYDQAIQHFDDDPRVNLLFLQFFNQSEQDAYYFGPADENREAIQLEVKFRITDMDTIKSLSKGQLLFMPDDYATSGNSSGNLNTRKRDDSTSWEEEHCAIDE